MNKIDIDYREKDIITLFENTKKVVKVGEKGDILNYQVCNLIIGDFIIKNEEGELLYIIERKSMKDFCASIIDGRMSEQRSRLFESIKDTSKIIYIIEGVKEASQGITKQTINSCILNLIFKHNYRVILTDSKQDTVDNLILLYRKIENNELEKKIGVNIQPIKFIKKSDSLNNNIFINMLSAIPGVSINIAIKIKDKYESMYNLINEYNNINLESREKMLINIEITSKRKLGLALSKKIYNAVQQPVKIVSAKESSEVLCLI